MAAKCISQKTAYAGVDQIATDPDHRDAGACAKAASHRTENLLPPSTGSGNLSTATPLNHGPKRGPVAKRRFQKGCFQLKDGKAYSFYYEDYQQPDGALATRKVRHLIGAIGPDV